MSALNKKKLEDLLWGAAEFLRGPIDASDYKQYIFPRESMEEQARVVSRVNRLMKKVKAMNSEIQSQLDDLQALKNSILDVAFKGEF